MKNKKILVRVNEKELADIKEISKKLGLTMSSYIRMAALKQINDV